MALLSLERRSTDSSVAYDLDSFLLRLLHPMLRPSGCFICNSSECRPDSSFGTEDYFSPVPLLHHSHHCQDPAAMPPHFYQGADMGSSNFTSVRTSPYFCPTLTRSNPLLVALPFVFDRKPSFAHRAKRYPFNPPARTRACVVTSLSEPAALEPVHFVRESGWRTRVDL